MFCFDAHHIHVYFAEGIAGGVVSHSLSHINNGGINLLFSRFNNSIAVHSKDFMTVRSGISLLSHTSMTLYCYTLTQAIGTAIQSSDGIVAVIDAKFTRSTYCNNELAMAQV